MVLAWLPRIYIIIVILHQMYGYVLFAANLDDFRSIAKKFIPEKLADQLAEMASDSALKYHKKVKEDAEYESNESEGHSVTKPHTKEIPKSIAKKRYVVKNPIPEVNIDELVDIVKERLFKGKKNNQKPSINEQKAKNKHAENKIKLPNDDTEIVYYSQNNYEDENVQGDQEPDYEVETLPEPRHKPKDKEPQSDKEIKENEESVNDPMNDKQKDYEEEIKDPTPNQYDDGKIFQEVDLRNTNDSYEEYATPDKRKIFESEEAITKRKTLRQTIKRSTTERSSPRYYEEVKGRTESLLYDEKEIRVNRTRGGALRNLKTTKKGKGTMIPTRHYYKMNSPNYYKKLPVIAEKYNFDEPLPEKDRERENLKPIGNPPASINKKVRL